MNDTMITEHICQDNNNRHQDYCPSPRLREDANDRIQAAQQQEATAPDDERHRFQLLIDEPGRCTPFSPINSKLPDSFRLCSGLLLLPANSLSLLLLTISCQFYHTLSFRLFCYPHLLCCPLCFRCTLKGPLCFPFRLFPAFLRQPFYFLLLKYLWRANGSLDTYFLLHDQATTVVRGKIIKLVQHGFCQGKHIIQDKLLYVAIVLSVLLVVLNQSKLPYRLSIIRL